jgi:peroxiredoxin
MLKNTNNNIMKTSLIRLLVILTFTISAFSAISQNTDGHNFRFTIKGLKEGSNCILAYYYYSSQPKLDSAVSNAKGEVEFKGTEKYPQGVYLLFFPKARPGRQYFDFIMDATQNFSIETDTTDYIKNMKVKGSEENKSFFEFQNFMTKKQKDIEPLREQYKKVKDNKDSAKLIKDKMAVIDKEVKDYRHNFIKDHPKLFVSNLLKAMEEPEVPEAPLLPDGKKDTLFAFHYYKTHFFDNIDFSDERLLRTPIFHSKVKQYMDKLTVQNPAAPDSIMASADYIIEKGKANPEVFKYLVNLLVYDYESSKIMGMDAVFVHLVDRYYKTKQVTWVDSTRSYKVMERAYILKGLLIGKKAPAIVMQDTTGKPVALYDVKAKYTVVVFWDESCGHCKKDIPKLSEMYKNKLKAMGVEVYAIETENSLKGWKKFIVEHQLNWINVIEQDDYKRAVTKKIYDVYKTPIIYLLDENKIIKAKQIDSEQLENFIEILEKEKSKK